MVLVVFVAWLLCAIFLLAFNYSVSYHTPEEQEMLDREQADYIEQYLSELRRTKATAC